MHLFHLHFTGILQLTALARGAAWARLETRNVGGRCWTEVFCGDVASGRWLHVDPLLGVMDRYNLPAGRILQNMGITIALMLSYIDALIVS